MASGFKGVTEDSRIERRKPRPPGRHDTSKPMMVKEFPDFFGRLGRRIGKRFRSHRRRFERRQAPVSATVAAITPVLDALETLRKHRFSL